MDGSRDEVARARDARKRVAALLGELSVWTRGWVSRVELLAAELDAEAPFGAPVASKQPETVAPAHAPVATRCGVCGVDDECRCCPGCRRFVCETCEESHLCD